MFRFSRSAVFAGLAVAAAVLAAGCAPRVHAPSPVDPAAGAERLLARDLSDADLRRYLARQGIATAQWPPTSWTLDALTAAAIYFDDDIAVARARWREGVAAEAVAARRRGLDLAPSLAWDSRPDSPGDSPFTAGVAVTVPMPHDDRRAARREAARAEAAARAFEVMRRGWERRAAVRRAVVGCYAADEGLAAASAQRRIHETIAAVYERRHGLGDVGIATVARARRDVETAAREEAAAVGAREACRGRLAAALGVPARAAAGLPLDTRSLERVLTLPPLPAAVRRAALTGRLDIRAALARHAAAEARLALAVARRWPDIVLEPGLFWDQGGLVWTLGSGIGRWLRHDAEGPVRVAAAARETAARAVLARQTSVLAALAAADSDLAAARARQEASTAAVQRAADARAVAERGLARGETGRLAVLEADLRVAAAKRAETDARVAVLAAAAAYEDIVERPVVGAAGFDVAAMTFAERAP